MYITNDVLQLLKSCVKDSTSLAHIKHLQLPLSEFLYTVIIDGGELKNRFSSLEHLSQLMDQYRVEHPDCTLTAEELLHDGWLTPFMDRWDFNIRPGEMDLESDTLSPEFKERIAVLRWLLERRKETGGIFVPRFSEILLQFQQKYPEMPDETWFVQNGFLLENRRYLSHGRYSGEIAEALAFVWARQVDIHNVAQLDWWLELASEFNMLYSAFGLLSDHHQTLLLERIISRLEEGTYPDIQDENIRITLSQSWRWDQPVPCMQYITGDLAVDFHTFDRSYWSWGQALYQRQKIISCYLSTLCDYLGILKKPLFTRAVRIIRCLANIGCLNEVHIPAPALLRLWQSPETSIVACERMLFHYIQKPALQDDLFCTVLHKIAEQVVLDRCQSMEDGTEYLSLMRFFAHQPIGGRLGDCAAKALACLLTLLKRGRQRLEPMLDSLVRELALYLEQESDYLTWARDFRLACLVMQKIYYHGNVPVARSAHSFQNLRGVLFAQYMRIFPSDGVLREAVPNFLDDTCFSHPFWCDVYEEKQNDLMEQCRFLQPELAPPEGEERGLPHYYKCKIHLTVLTTLMQNQHTSDTLLEKAFVQTLVQVLRPKNDLLNYDRIAIIGAQPILEAAIALAGSDEKYYDPFMKEVEKYGLPELVMICHGTGSNDSKLRRRCCQLIEDHAEEASDDLRIFSFDKLVQLILDEKVESLYPMVERILERQLKRLENLNTNTAHQKKNLMKSQLNRVWLQEKAYDKILEQGLLFYQALVWMESPEHRDLTRAENVWEQLLEKSIYSGYAINLLCTYSLQYDAAAQSKDNGTDACRKIVERAEILRERMENDAYFSWAEQDQQAYALTLYKFYCQTGTDQEKAVRLLSQELKLSPDLFEQLGEDEISQEVADQITIELKNPVSMLRQYRSASLYLKSEWFFQLKSSFRPKEPQTALLLWCVMNTLSHLSAYGPQLIINDTLSEDRCTQLFRELFNHGYPEMYGLSANDQEQSGHTGHKNRNGSAGIGEVDLTIKHDGHRVGIVEALKLSGMNQPYISEHVRKLQGYNSQYIPMFLFVYGNTAHPEDLWQSYSDYIKNSFAPEFYDENWGSCEVQDFTLSNDYIPNLHHDFHFCRHMLRMTFRSNGRELPTMYHIFLNIGSLENLSSAVEARKKHRDQ